MLRIIHRLPRQVGKATLPLRLPRPLKHCVRCISNKPNEVYTELSDENDPQRDAFFKYTWGSWLSNDSQEKEKRLTKFSIIGLTDVISDLLVQSRAQAKETQDNKSIPAPSYNPNLTVSLPHNLSVANMGTLNPDEALKVTAMASIHEGKHHRIYKVDTNAGKAFVLRIPYATTSEAAISYRLKSEVATMDFADLKLGLKVPKVFCFGANALNPIRQPFVLEEYIEGRLLMRDWTPLEDDAPDKKSHLTKLNKVIEPLSQFQSKLLSIEFNQFGSLYFAKDCPESETPAYDGEENESLQNRWRIGPSVEPVSYTHLDVYKRQYRCRRSISLL